MGIYIYIYFFFLHYTAICVETKWRHIFTFQWISFASELGECYTVTVSVTSPTSGLSCSPAATRRISSGCILNPPDAIIAAGTKAASFRNRSRSLEKDNCFEDKSPTKRLPIINPHVRSPMWPSKCDKFQNELLWAYMYIILHNMYADILLEVQQVLREKICCGRSTMKQIWLLIALVWRFVCHAMLYFRNGCCDTDCMLHFLGL